jgi:hypothetical protein
MAFALLIASSTPLLGGHTPPPQSNSLMGEASAFVADFSQWNENHSDLPMQFLESSPAENQGGAALILFWLWLHDSVTLSNSGASLSHLIGPTNFSRRTFPSDSN